MTLQMSSARNVKADMVEDRFENHRRRLSEFRPVFACAPENVEASFGRCLVEES